MVKVPQLVAASSLGLNIRLRTVSRQLLVTVSRDVVPDAQDTTVVQLFPYGWQLPDGSIMREAYFRGMTDATNAPYYRWMNPHPQHACFKRCVCAPRGSSP